MNSMLISDLSTCAWLFQAPPLQPAPLSPVRLAGGPTDLWNSSALPETEWLPVFPVFRAKKRAKRRNRGNGWMTLETQSKWMAWPLERPFSFTNTRVVHFHVGVKINVFSKVNISAGLARLVERAGPDLSARREEKRRGENGQMCFCSVGGQVGRPDKTKRTKMIGL